MQKKIIIGLILTLFIVVFIPLYWATEPGRQEAARAQMETEATERGGKVFATACIACHGINGDALPGINLKQTKLDDEGLVRVVSRGRGNMPAFAIEEGGPLKEHEIIDVITFIRNWDQSLLETTSPTPAPPAQTQPTPTQTTPVSPTTTPSTVDAAKVFADRCVLCHGTNRQEAAGLGPALTPTAIASLTDSELRDIILNGRTNTMMPPFKAILNPDEIDALLQFLRSTQP